MPPLHVTSYSHDSPTQGRRTSGRRSSALVPFEVLHSAKLGIIEPQPEEPQGTCMYARDSVVNTGDDEIVTTQKRLQEARVSFLLQDNGTTTTTMGSTRRNSRGASGAGRQRRSVNATAANTNEEKSLESMFSRMGCIDDTSACIIS
jgi:hypothetical protein